MLAFHSDIACLILFFNLFLVDLSGFLATESKCRPTVHAASRHGTASLTSLPKDNHLEFDLTRPSITSATSGKLFKPLGHSATHPKILLIIYLGSSNS